MGLPSRSRLIREWFKWTGIELSATAGIKFAKIVAEAIRLLKGAKNNKDSGGEERRVRKGNYMTLTNLVLIALFVEAIVQQLKPIWDKTAGKITVAEIVSMCLGVLIAVAWRRLISWPGWWRSASRCCCTFLYVPHRRGVGPRAELRA